MDANEQWAAMKNAHAEREAEQEREAYRREMADDEPLPHISGEAGWKDRLQRLPVG